MKNKTQEVTFESYLKKVSNQKLEKRKSDKYSYDEGITQSSDASTGIFVFVLQELSKITAKAASFVNKYLDLILEKLKKIKNAASNEIDAVKNLIKDLLKKITMPKAKKGGMFRNTVASLKKAKRSIFSNYEYESDGNEEVYSEEFYNENFNLPFSKPNPGNVIKIVYRVKDHKININSITGEVVIDGKNPEAIWEEIFPGRGIKTSYKWKKNEWNVIKKYIEGDSKTSSSKIKDSETDRETSSSKNKDSETDRETSSSKNKDSETDRETSSSKNKDSEDTLTVEDVKKAEKEVLKPDESLTPFYKRQIFWVWVAIVVIVIVGIIAFLHLRSEMRSEMQSADNWAQILIGLGNLKQLGVNEQNLIDHKKLGTKIVQLASENKLLDDKISAVNYKDTINAIATPGTFENFFTGQGDKIRAGQEAVASAVKQFETTGEINGSKLAKDADVVAILKDVYEKAANAKK